MTEGQIMETDGRKQKNKVEEILLYPLVLLNKGLNALLKKAIGEGYGEKVTEDDILSLVDAGNESGTIEDTSVEMINNVFDYNDLCVYDVMTHRVNITAIDINSSLAFPSIEMSRPLRNFITFAMLSSS